MTTRYLPWSGLGTKLGPDVTTAAQAMKNSGLDWTVQLAPVCAMLIPDDREKPPTYSPIDDRHAVIRSSDSKALGVVGSHYVPFQNTEAFAFMDTLVGTGAARYDSAGSLRGGKIVFLACQIPRTVLVGGEDRHDIYTLLRTSHDGTKAISVYVTIIRSAATTTLSLATHNRSVKQKWSMTHVATVHGRIAEAKNTQVTTLKYADEFKKMGDKLLRIRLRDEEFTQLLDRVLPDRPKTQDVKAAINTVYHESATVRYHGTGWGALAAITEYFDWFRRSGSPEARLINTVDGIGAKTRNTAAALLLVRG